MSELGAGIGEGGTFQFIPGLIAEGISANEGLRRLQSAGFGMNRQTFLRVWGEARDALGSADALAGMDYNVLPGADRYSTWETGNRQRYATFVRSFVREVGSTNIETRYYIHFTDSPHTGADALNAAQGSLIEGEAANPAYGHQAVVGQLITTMARTVPLP